ncbi:DNA repair protein RadA OS=Lysinibacillus sphaericus OX=1421 GN=radA PE=3 SV=1 [Lysinibacillus sphaericus]
MLETKGICQWSLVGDVTKEGHNCGAWRILEHDGTMQCCISKENDIATAVFYGAKKTALAVTDERAYLCNMLQGGSKEVLLSRQERFLQERGQGAAGATMVASGSWHAVANWEQVKINYF